MMRVALVDPSLFTLPYDVAFSSALRGAGAEVVIYGRQARREDGVDGALEVHSSFYAISGSKIVASFPEGARLAIKGVDHQFGMRRLGSEMLRFNPDVIHFQWFPLPILDVLYLRGLRKLAPIVLTVHDTSPFNGSPSAALQRVGFRRCLRACDHLIVHTRQGFERLVALGVSASRISQIAHGPLDLAHSVKSGGAMLGRVTFTLFGKMKHYKGADILIRAFAGLPEGLRSQARVRIIGQPYLDVGELRELAGRLHVGHAVDIEPRFVDADEMRDVFPDSCVAVFPYREIEASGVLSLALAAGRPIIASRIGCFADTIVDGAHGRLVPPNDVAALSAAMAEMVADRSLTARYAAAARELSSSLPGWAEIAQDVMDLYARLGSERRGASSDRTSFMTSTRQTA